VCHLRYKHADDACIYNSITGSLKRAGFTEQEGTSARDRCAWNVRWGKHMLADAFKELRSYQRINHFPGTGGIGRKDRLARNIARSRRRLGGDKYNFLPETYLLPADRGLWESKFGAEPPGTLWIAKPNSSSCGRGIRLVSKITDLAPTKACIVSRYIANPLLVNERKFDLRIYVLCTSFNPLKIYVYTNGLARFCTSKYDVSKKNLRKKYIVRTLTGIHTRSRTATISVADSGIISVYARFGLCMAMS
jgi:tubulin polyglutamylase TTLL4